MHISRDIFAFNGTKSGVIYCTLVHNINEVLMIAQCKWGQHSRTRSACCGTTRRRRRHIRSRHRRISVDRSTTAFYHCSTYWRLSSWNRRSSTASINAEDLWRKEGRCQAPQQKHNENDQRDKYRSSRAFTLL